MSELRKTSFEPIEDFFRIEGKRYGVLLPDPVDVFLAPAVPSPPPAAPFGGNVLRIVFWSLQLRAWAWWNDTYKGPKPDVRLFVLFHDPAVSPRLAHSTGLKEGLIGVVNAFADSDHEGSNNVVIAHELLHTLGRNRQIRPGRESAALSRAATPIRRRARASRRSAPKSWAGAFRSPKIGPRSRNG